MTAHDCDLFIIGGGSGGVRAARMAAQRGARVVLAEGAAMGGTCVNVGCIPKKLYSYAAHYAADFVDAAGFGWETGLPHLDWNRLKAARAAEITRLNGVYEHLLRAAGVQLVRGWARFGGPHTVEVVEGETVQVFTAERVLVASGGAPVVPPIAGRELVVTSDDMFDLDPFPQRLVVVGGGYIGCEFASIFQGLGSRVTLLHRGDQVLRGFDDEVRHFIAHEMRRNGIDVRLGAGVEAVERTSEGLAVRLGDGGLVSADTVLFATGRAPRTAGLRLDAAGLAADARGALAVDAAYRTQVPSILAVGDVTDRLQLTPVALAEAMVVVENLFGAGDRTLDYALVPTAVFTHPNIGTVGLTEAEARARFGRIAVFRSDFKPLKHTLSGSGERTLVKLLVDCASDRVVGLHMVGPEAGEIVQGFAVAMKAGATKAVFDATLGIHPTLAEEFVTLREPLSGTVAAVIPQDRA